jgi:hypothetical protein
MSEAADAPLDEVDATILDELAAVDALVDPPPADLDARVSFALALRHVDAEVARLSEDLLVGSGARGAGQPRTITFDADRLTIMVTVVVVPGGRLRVDGWLAPAGPLRVELRTAERAGTFAAAADDTGRFVVDGVPPGLAQLIVHLPEPGRTVVTPTVVL